MGKLKLERIKGSRDATLGVLSLNGRFLCFTLEDEYRSKKVWGETRIPAGTYDVGVRDEGGFHGRYTRRFPGMHKGMLELKDVPGFKYILIHVGNDDDDTAGCILVGRGADAKSMTVSRSVDAYLEVYPQLIDLALQGDLVIEVVDRDR